MKPARMTKTVIPANAKPSLPSDEIAALRLRVAELEKQVECKKIMIESLLYEGGRMRASLLNAEKYSEGWDFVSEKVKSVTGKEGV